VWVKAARINARERDRRGARSPRRCWNFEASECFDCKGYIVETKNPTFRLQLGKSAIEFVNLELPVFIHLTLDVHRAAPFEFCENCRKRSSFVHFASRQTNRKCRRGIIRRLSGAPRKDETRLRFVTKAQEKSPSKIERAFVFSPPESGDWKIQLT
jgi:hypothetical protein